MVKYYLLTFDQDYADEHDVPAIECMTEEQYNKWLETPSGKLNPKYEELMVNYNNYQEAKKDLDLRIRSSLGDRWVTVQFTQWPPDLLKDYNELHKTYGYNSSWPRHPQKVRSFLRANLGNSGDGFEENFQHLYLMREFVEQGIVKVFEVNEDFYNTFHKAELKRLSLCNVFSDLEDWDEDADFEDENE